MPAAAFGTPRTCFNGRPAGESTLARRWLPSMRAVSGIQTDDRASLPVPRVRMDAAYKRIAAVLHRGLSDLGSWFLSLRRPVTELEWLLAGHQRVGAVPGR